MEKLQINTQIHTNINDRIIYAKKLIYNLAAADLVEEVLTNREGQLADTGALCVNTGQFTGRSPKDRYIVMDEETKDSVFWGDINKPVSPDVFERLLNKVVDNLRDKTVYVRDAYACANKDYRLNVRVINTMAWHNLFCYNMFLRPVTEELENFNANFTIICDP
jgi:phosphoenolpyruvate carboxykinase (ATP)